MRIHARSLGAEVELHFLDAPLQILWDRVQQRKMEDPPVTKEDWTRWNTMIERPTEEELACFDAHL